MRFRWGTLVTMVAAVNVVAISMWINPPPKLIWNASASVPIGFYTVRPASDLRIGDLAVVTPPDDVAVFLSTGGYLPLGVPLIKPVAALPGQHVRSEEHTSELQSLMRISYAVFCLKKKTILTT